MSVSTRQYMGVMTNEWQYFSQTNAVLLKNAGATVLKDLLRWKWWDDNVVGWLKGDRYQTKLLQNRQWLRDNTIKYYIDSDGRDWDPAEGWDVMRADAIMNVDGKGDLWISKYCTIIQALQPDIIGLMNEPVISIASRYGVSENEFFNRYRTFCIKAIAAYKAVKPDLVFAMCALPFWDFTRIAANPVPGIAFYDLHYYYMYDNTYPPPYSLDRIAYWEGRLVEAKTLLYNYLLYNQNVQAMLNANLAVVLGEVGTHILNPNAQVFMQDLFDFGKTYNLGVIQECFRAWNPSLGYYGTGILNTDWETLNPLGDVWKRNMLGPAPQYVLTVTSNPSNIPFTLTKMV